MLEWMLREAGQNDALTKAVRAWRRLLKKIRRAAAPVRDLDVQRKLLKEAVPVIEMEMKVSTEEPESGMAGQLDKLDHALKDQREDDAAALKKNAAKWAAKLDSHLDAVAIARRGSALKVKPDAAEAALAEFGRVAARIGKLDVGNLHDFRKGIKKARYITEGGGKGKRAKTVGDALKRIQGEIGDWHDWLLLAERAHKHLGKKRSGLVTEIDRMRDVHFEIAMKTVGKLRRKLAVTRGSPWQAQKSIKSA